MGKVLTAGLRELCRELKLEGMSRTGRTNEERREGIWKALDKGRGRETVRISQALWEAANEAPSGATVGEFQVIWGRKKLAVRRPAASGSRGTPSREGRHSATPARGPDGQAPGSAGATDGDAPRPEEEVAISMDDKDMGEVEATDTPRSGEEEAMDEAGNPFEGWTLAQTRKRAQKKQKRPAMQSPMVEVTPARRRERARDGAGGAGRADAADAAGAAAAHAAEERRGTVAALRTAGVVLEEAQDCMEAVLAVLEEVGGDTGLRARCSASYAALRTLCAGMQIQRLRSVATEQRRAAQDLQRARKEVERDKKQGAAEARVHAEALMAARGVRWPPCIRHRPGGTPFRGIPPVPFSFTCAKLPL